MSAQQSKYHVIKYGLDQIYRRIEKNKQRRKMESWIMVSETRIASTTRAAQATNMDTDIEQSTQRQAKSKDNTPSAATWSTMIVGRVPNHF